MDEIERSIDALLAVIKDSGEYRDYQKQEEILSRNPELMGRVNQFRSNNFKLQNEADRDELFHVVERLSRESSELRRIPEVNAYLDAELALCRLMQKICLRLTKGIEMNVPELS